MVLKKLLTAAALIGSVYLNAQTYFQQEVDYKINVKLNDEKHELSAFETIEYRNNSPETLTFIWFHIWPNAYKDNSTALGKQLLHNGKTRFYWAKDEERGYIDSLNFTGDGVALKTQVDSQYIDIIKVYLDKPLAPGAKVTIATPFKVKIPVGEFSRLGHIDQQYQITQWYPKPAVFDNRGWHPLPYLDQGEFYSEFGSFEVKITLPENYVVAATGDLQEQSEIDWIDKRVEATTNGTLPKGEDFPASSTTYKTITYKQTLVHDFAWFADKRYWVAKSEVVLPQSSRKVSTYAYYTPTYRNLWGNATKYINDAVYYYSLWNGDYPYSHCSAVDGALSAGGGMEYPNVTVIGKASNAFMLETVIMHEVGHNWFYGILGSNERENGWMDEGVNSANEMRYIYTKYPKKRIDIGIPEQALKPLGIGDKKNRYLYYLAYLFTTRENVEQPIQTHSADFTELNYGAVMYMKTATVFDYLKSYLGDELFDKCMHAYFDKWKFKHPYPEDMRKVFEDQTGKNLSWFFDDMLKTTKRIDYKLNVKDGLIKVTNRGQVAGPFSVSTIKNDSIISTAWFEGFKGKKEFTFNTTNADHIKLDADERMPEFQRKNNYSRTKGIFKSVEPVNIRIIPTVEDPRKSRLYVTPVIGWNYYNHFMVGLAFYNHTIPQRKFEYTLMPMYATGTKSLNGEGSVNYNILPQGSKVFKQISPRFYASSYHYDKNASGYGDNLRYIKLAPEVMVYFKRKPANSNIQQSVRLRYVYLTKNVLKYNVGDSLPTKGNLNYNVFDYTYAFKNSRAINPFGFNVHLQHNKDMVKTWAEANFHINYSSRKRSGLDIRVFAGAFLYNTNSTSVDYRFRLSGQTGFQDYLYDNIYLGRNEGSGIWFNQFVENDGGFKMWSPSGQSNNWIVSVNLKSSLPGKTLEKLPIKLYASFGTREDVYNLNKKLVAYEAGPYLSIISGVFEVYFPALVTKQIKEAASLNGVDKYYQRIRFTLNLNMLKPFDALKKINF